MCHGLSANRLAYDAAEESSLARYLAAKGQQQNTMVSPDFCRIRCVGDGNERVSFEVV